MVQRVTGGGGADARLRGSGLVFPGAHVFSEADAVSMTAVADFEYRGPADTAELTIVLAGRARSTAPRDLGPTTVFEAHSMSVSVSFSSGELAPGRYTVEAVLTSAALGVVDRATHTITVEALTPEFRNVGFDF